MLFAYLPKPNHNFLKLSFFMNKVININFQGSIIPIEEWVGKIISGDENA